MKREVWQHECGTIEDNQGNLYKKIEEKNPVLQRCKGVILGMFPNYLSKIKGKKK